jgi:calcineurin-like phosphoesterase family protein
VRATCCAALLVIAAGSAFVAQTGPVIRPRLDAVTFAVIGDSGTGDRVQYELARQMAATYARVPFDLVIMLGDNIYGGQSAQDFVRKFEQPYKPLLESGVRFYAALGNHDHESNRYYPPFNMNGQRYYSYAVRNVRFVVLDSDYIDDRQKTWLEGTLKNADDPWKICYFHHPLYSDGGRHGSQVDLRVLLEPIFIKYDVNVVFAGHDHVYERVAPQHGIHYFIEGAGGQLRRGDVHRSAMTAAAFDQDRSFMLVQIAGDELSFEAISRTGILVDSGVIRREARP